MGIKSVKPLSAGLAAKNGDSINRLAELVLKENGLPCEKFSSTLLTEKLLRESFAVVCMTESQRDIVMDMRWHALRGTGAEEIENNVYSFSEISGYEIYDPYGKDQECYRYVFGLLEAGMSALIEKFELKALIKTAKKPKKEREVNATPKKRGRPKKNEKKGEEV